MYTSWGCAYILSHVLSVPCPQAPRF
jgi:hypothetical protein